MPTHLEVWQDMWSLYCECFRESFGQHPVELSPVALESFGVRLQGEIRAHVLLEAAKVARDSYPKNSEFDVRMKIAAHSIAGTLERMASSPSAALHDSSGAKK